MRKREKIDRSGYLFDNKALVALIIPLVIEQLLAVLVGMADSVMIASVGEAAVSGVSLVDQVMVLLINVFSALATGGAVVAGQYLGQKRQNRACEAATQLVWFILFASLLITGIAYVGKDFILHTVFGQIEPDVMAHARTYLMIVAASIPFIALYNAGAAIFRTMGHSKVTMVVSMIMNVINVSGNAILIYGFHRGTEGVAIPTLVSRMTAAVIILVLLCNQKLLVHVERSLKYRPNWSQVKAIMSIGIPNGLESSMFQLGKILVLSLVSTFGTYAIAANAVSNTVAMFQILPGLAICLAVTPVVSQCVGAGDYEQAKYYNKKLLIITYIGMALMVTLTLVLLPFILKIYGLSEQTSEIVREILYFHGICVVLFWPLSFTLPATFRASGDARACMIVSIASMWVFRIGCCYVLAENFGLGVFGVWVAMIIDWIFRLICFVIRYFRGSWMKKTVV